MQWDNKEKVHSGNVLFAINHLSEILTPLVSKLCNRDNDIIVSVITEVGLKVIEECRKGVIIHNFTAFVRKIAPHRVIDYYRANAEQRSSEVYPDNYKWGKISDGANLPDMYFTKKAEEIEGRFFAKIEIFLKDISEDILNVYLLRKEGKSHKEISKTLGISLDMSRQNILEAKKLIRAKFSKEYQSNKISFI